MKKSIFIMLILLLSILEYNLYAETVDGPANVREEPNGKLLYSINDGLEITPIENHKDWFFIKEEMFAE